ncbi:ABC transporter substrate-binding protein [Thermochromatium tepidum]|uniref:ABC transporter substrate-binding protein n=1 Tax=Thermochromatium tepidum ATCC 43061 TaxID=316276 RepID=A0A6I6DY34_THETI|nr:ABC transporter substrate-binding protein [Thermochromatium tepidum]QGU32501.1 ABC transporter substrate-binding protein [Thermochromatium tepidum ATCC 43061]
MSSRWVVLGRHTGWLVGGVMLWVAPVLATTPLPSVMSTNLCADLLLLRIADPGQIRSVSRQGQDARISPVADQARAYPGNRGGVEDLLYFKPDIALVYQGWMGRPHAKRLAGQGIEVIALPYPRGWDEALQTARALAARLGRAETGAALIEGLERRMQALARPRGAGAPRLLYLRPSGGTAGQGTYVDDLIRRLGLRNLAAEQGIKGWGRFPLERLVSAPPDVFLLGYFDQAQSPARSAYGRHPRLRSLLELTPAIELPGQAWGCGGLELLEVAEQISAQLTAIDQTRSRTPSP